MTAPKRSLALPALLVVLALALGLVTLLSDPRPPSAPPTADAPEPARASAAAAAEISAEQAEAEANEADLDEPAAAPVDAVAPRKSVRVEGVVLAPTGEPVVRAEVGSGPAAYFHLRATGVDSPGFVIALTDERGRFALEGALGEPVDLTARASGFAPSATLRVAPVDGVVRDVALQLHAGGRLEGVVFGLSGAPGPSREVRAFRTDEPPTLQAVCGDDGRFALEHLPPGDWRLMSFPTRAELEALDLDADDPFVRVAHVAAARARVLDGELVTVALGAPPEHPIAVRGRVRVGAGSIAARVQLLPERGDPIGRMRLARTARDGTFATELAEPGPYVAVVLCSQPDEFGAAAFDVEIEPDGAALELALPLGSIAGRVVDTYGEPIAYAPVSLRRADRIERLLPMLYQSTNVLADAQGAFLFRYLRPGEYCVTAGGLPGALGTPGQVQVSGLVLRPGERRAGVDFRLGPGGTLSGRVLDDDGRPVALAAVFVRDAAGRVQNATSGTYTDAEGTFRYPGLAPGRYRASARTATSCAVDSAPIEVVPGLAATVELRARRGGFIDVRARDAAGRALAASISVRDAGGAEHADLVDLQRLWSALEEGFSRGRARVGPLPPGEYRISAVAADGRSAARALQLDAADESELELELGP